MSPVTAERRGDRDHAAEPARDLAASRSGPPDSEEGTSTILTPNSDEEEGDYPGAMGEGGIELRALKPRRADGGREYHGVDALTEWEGDADSEPRKRARRASASTVASFQLYTPD